jgi:hypothetical protein
MPALPLLLAMSLASPGPSLRVAPPADPGPFGGGELAASSVGALAGDALVIGAGYGALQLFANGTFRPTAGNFRTAALAIGVSAIVLPPLTAALLGRWAQAEPASGAFWKALLLATAGQAVALGVGLAAYPRLWVIVPVQLVAVSLGTTLGLHWGSRGGVDPRLDARGDEPAPPAPPPAEARAAPYCPDPALAVR